MGLFLANEVKSLYLGDKEVVEVYLGSKKLWPEKIIFHVDLYSWHPRNGYSLYLTITFETSHKTWGESVNIYDTTNQYYIDTLILPSGGNMIGVRTKKGDGSGLDAYYAPENGENIINELIIDNYTYSLYEFS